MVPLVVIRPEPGCSATVSAARAQRLEAFGYPLFTLEPRPWTPPPAAGFDAVLAGSAAAFRLGGRGLAGLRALPVLAVGKATAEAARAAGMAVAATGSGGLQSVIDHLDPGCRRLLRLAGDERVPLTLPPGVTMEERVVYASTAQPMPPELVELVRQPAVILLHSAEAARHLTAQCVRNGVRRSPLRLAALAPRIAAAAGDGWGEVAVAAIPGDDALLALARQMCQEPGYPVRSG